MDHGVSADAITRTRNLVQTLNAEQISIVKMMVHAAIGKGNALRAQQRIAEWPRFVEAEENVGFQRKRENVSQSRRPTARRLLAARKRVTVGSDTVNADRPPTDIVGV